jgi:hypothetical protein
MDASDGWERFVVREEQRCAGQDRDADAARPSLRTHRDRQRELVEASLRARPPVLDGRGHERN